MKIKKLPFLKFDPESFHKRSKREKVVIVAGFTLILISCLDFLMIKPFFVERERLKKEVFLGQKIWKQQQKILSLEHRIKQEHRIYAKNLKVDSSEGQIVTDLLSLIEQAAQKTKIKIVNMNPRTAKDRGELKILDVSVIAMGTMIEFASFFSELENSETLVGISRLQLSKSDQKSSSVDELKAEMVVFRSYQK